MSVPPILQPLPLCLSSPSREEWAVLAWCDCLSSPPIGVLCTLFGWLPVRLWWGLSETWDACHGNQHPKSPQIWYQHSRCLSFSAHVFYGKREKAHFHSPCWVCLLNTQSGWLSGRERDNWGQGISSSTHPPRLAIFMKCRRKKIGGLHSMSVKFWGEGRVGEGKKILLWGTLEKFGGDAGKVHFLHLSIGYRGGHFIIIHCILQVGVVYFSSMCVL